MEWWKILLIALGIVGAGFCLRLWAKSEKPLGGTLRMILRSEAVLFAAHLGGILAGLSIPLSPATLLWTAFTGFPGVVALIGAEWLLR